MAPALSTSPCSRIRHLTPNPRLHLQFHRLPSPTHQPQLPHQTPQGTQPSIPSRPRSFSTGTHYRTPWPGTPPSENAGTDKPTEKYQVEHDESQKAKQEKAKGDSGSAGLEGEPVDQTKEAKKKVKVEFPKAAKQGPIIGMEDERGGKGA
ncbi:5cd1ef3c-cfdb-480c-80ec-a1a0c939d4cb-CDS [Sclerotinia trifoliorum]|uniref:5cd1ef3c-cfdb-480c-80ec-a1a0c939d4cb-CDS n=1 Tax=Sclerotinia trifoliorum TaxID=28548 RepID=A0A8H2VQ51_9HELO|nr:5cd1ef3c-cfdb-480c-80ec-a1a0c939d4cb-CDS [Sclerotinia trifoliorum]